MAFKQWFASASATFAGGAVAVGLVAIPSFVWFPREMDSLSARVDMSIEASNEAKDASITAATASIRTEQSQNALTLEFAKISSRPVGSFDNLAIMAGDLPINLQGGHITKEQFLSLFPVNVADSIEKRDLTSKFSYANVAGAEWIFISYTDLNNLDSEVIDVVRETIVNAGYSLKTDF